MLQQRLKLRQHNFLMTNERSKNLSDILSIQRLLNEQNSLQVRSLLVKTKPIKPIKPIQSLTTLYQKIHLL